MNFSNSYLERCEAARRDGFPLLHDVGDVIGRGFADIGYELFVVLPGERILSLLTGEKSHLQPADEQHYFSVPTADTVVEILESTGNVFVEGTRPESREWIVKIQLKNGEEKACSDSSLVLALLKAFSAES